MDQKSWETKEQLKSSETRETLCIISEGNTKERKAKSMMPALYVLRLAQRHILGRSDVKQWKNQARSFIHYWVMCWRHQLVSHMQNNKNLKFCKNFLEGVGIILKAFLGLAIPSQNLRLVWQWNFGAKKHKSGYGSSVWYYLIWTTVKPL